MKVKGELDSLTDIHTRMTDFEGFEDKSSGQEVHQHAGKWYMRYDQKTLGAEIPDDVAGKIIDLLSIQQTHTEQKELLQENTNCHAAAFYALGLIPDIRQWSTHHQYEVPLFRRQDYKRYASSEVMATDLKKQLGNEFGFAQGLGMFFGPEAVQHSFLVGLDTRDRPICFEKPGFGSLFAIVSLEKILSRRWYNDLLWHAEPISRIDRGEAAGKIRTFITERTGSSRG